jgi:MYXO-CTERM domain-containing protein
VILALLLALQNDKAQANGRDDAWEAAWIAHCKSLYTAAGKDLGMVLHIGDSITHANQYGRWPRQGAGKTAEDSAILAWCKAEQTFPASPTATDTNGFYLCAVDVANRSLTAAGGLSTTEYLTGSGNGGTAMPSTTDTAAARSLLLETLPTVPPTYKYTHDLHITTVAAAFSNAQFAVVMLGTNDANQSRAVADFSNDLTAIVNALEGVRIVVILSTIPPMSAKDVTPYNTAIRTLAQTRGLPLIDYYLEILARRPGTTWQGTLIGADGIHPTNAAPAANPYTPGGDPAAHRTGDNAANDGQLLRGWLTIQKLKEVKIAIVDAPAPAPGPGPGPAPAPPPAVASSGDNDNGEGCSCGTAAPRLPWAFALLGLLLVGRRR